MEHTATMDSQAAAVNQDQFMRQLKQTFEKLPHEIPIYMFVERGRDDIFSQTNRQIVRAFRELTSKITFREHPIGSRVGAQVGGRPVAEPSDRSGTGEHPLDRRPVGRRGTYLSWKPSYLSGWGKAI